MAVTSEKLQRLASSEMLEQPLDIKKESEFKLTEEQMTSFLISVEREGCKQNLISLIRKIGEGSFKEAAEFYAREKAVAVNKTVASDKRRDCKEFVFQLPKLLFRGLTLKIFNEEQIISFFDALKNIAFSDRIDFIAVMFEDSVKEEETTWVILITKLISIYFKHAIKEDKESDAVRCLMRIRGLDPVKNIITSEGYKLRNIQEQERLLKFLIKEILPVPARYFGAELLFQLKLANPKTFKEVSNSLDKEEQFAIDERLNNAPNSLMLLVENNKLDEAVQVFVQHPKSWMTLFETLDETVEGIPAAPQIYAFFNKVLEDEQGGFLLGLSLMRACFESKRFQDKYPDLFKSMVKCYLDKAFKKKEVKEACALLSTRTYWVDTVLEVYRDSSSDEEKKQLLHGFLDANEHNLNIALIQGLEKAAPALFEEVLETKDDVTKKTIKKLLLTDPKQENSHHLVEQLKLYEQDKISSFRFLQDPEEGIKIIRLMIDDGKDFWYESASFPQAAISGYLKRVIELGKIKEATDFLSLEPLWVKHILKAFQEQSKDVQEKLMVALLENCAKRFNAVMICGLKEISPQLFDDALKALKSGKIEERIKDLLKVPDEASSAISDLMKELTLPFRRITAYTAQLVCAEISRRKGGRIKGPYQFNPTVVDDSNLREYLTILRSEKPPIRRRFLIASDHWIAGEIDIPEKGNPRILLIDSLGEGEPKTDKIIETQCSGIFETLEIYISKEKRQHSELGCTVFVLRDIQELFTIGPYLNLYENSHKGDLFNYISENHSYYGGVKELRICVFPLPLRFMRSEQSRNVWNSLKGKGSELPVNKKGETAAQSVERHFETVGGKGVNKFLGYKLNKMVERVFSYLSAHNFDLVQVDAEVSAFSLEGFKAERTLKLEEKEKKELLELVPKPYLPAFSSVSKALHSSDPPGEKKIEVEKLIMVEKLNPSDQAMKTIRNLLQEKFKGKFSYLSDMVEKLYKQYVEGNIKDTKSLREAISTYYTEMSKLKETGYYRFGEEFDFQDKPKFIRGKDNEAHLETILKNLPLIEPFYPRLSKGRLSCSKRS